MEDDQQYDEVPISADTKDLVRYFLKTLTDRRNAEEVYKKLKEATQQRQKKEELIQLDIHLNLREAYRMNYQQQSELLEIIYNISLEEDFCDQLAILGNLVDEGYSFLITNIKTTERLQRDNTQGQQKEMIQIERIENLDSSTLLKLDIWIRIFSNFFKNEEVRIYTINNKSELINTMLVFLKNIDSVLAESDNLDVLNSMIIANNIQINVVESLFLLCENENAQRSMLGNSNYLELIIQQLLPVKEWDLFD